MLYTVLMTVICVLAVYGAMKTVFYLYGYFIMLKGDDKIKRHTVLFFKDNAEEAEVALRETILGRNPFCGEIIAVDMGSEDDTMRILRRFSKEYDLLRVMDFDEYIQFIKE